MAREMYLVGVEEEELQPTPPPEPPKTFKEKMHQFWYYYKWPTIIGAAALVVVIVLIVQAVTRPRYDYTIVLATDMLTEMDNADENAAYVDMSAVLSAELAKYGRDINGDGEIKVMVEHLSLSTNNIGSVNGSQKLMLHIAAGDVMFFVFDKASYESFEKKLEEGSQFFSPLDLDVENVNQEAGYYNWKDDPRRQEERLNQLPEELYFGTRSATGTAAKSEEEAAQCRELLIAFITDTPLTPAEDAPAQ